MLQIKDAIDEKTLSIIQKMFMQFLHSSTALYEADGTYVCSVFEGQYCSYLNDISYKNSGECYEEALSSGKWICHEECLRISKESMDKIEPLERECSGGINIYAVPIMYKGQVIGCINAAITNPPLERNKLESIAGLFNIDTGDLMKYAYAYKRLTPEEIEVARMQIKMASLLISSLYETKIKQIEAEREVKRQKEQLEAIINNMSDALYVFDKDGEFILRNKAALRYTPSSSYKNIKDSYNRPKPFDLEGNEIPHSSRPGERVLQGEKITQQILSYETPAGKKFFGFSGAPLYDDNGNLYIGIVCMRDITESKNQSQLIREQKYHLEAIMENMSEAVFIFDKKGKYVLINKAGRQLFVRDMENAGESFSFVEYFDLDGNKVTFDQTPIYHVLHGMEFTEQAVHMKFTTGEKYINWSGSPIFDENGNLMYGVVVGRDVTEKIKHEQTIKKQRETLLASEKAKKEALEKTMKMKDEFLTTITHEFKTPLTVINAAIQTINSLYDSQISDNVKKHLQRIRMNSFRQLRLVNNLLDITRYGAGHIKVRKQNLDIVFLCRAITESVMLFANQKGVALYFLSDIECKVMAVDEEKYERIMLNLLSNAIKFTPKGKSVYVHVACKGRRALISVKDEGIGIPRSKQELIFERFGQVDNSLTRQAEGTGIGLSLVKALVYSLGGTIALESEVGKGSTFTVTLPVTRLKKDVLEEGKLHYTNNRITQTVEIEFSDIYLS